MKVLIDTNVILDVLTRREPHFEHSAAFLRQCGARLTGCIAASQTTDIFYVLRREGVEAQAARDLLKKLTDNVKVVDTNAADVQAALAGDMPLLEGLNNFFSIDKINIYNEVELWVYLLLFSWSCL